MTTYDPARRLVLTGLATVFAGGFGPFDEAFAPKPELLPDWAPLEPAHARTIDHSRWESLLQRRLVIDDAGVARMRYGDFSREDKTALWAYLADLGEISIRSYGRAEQLAYWINLYNAAVVRTVLDHYPVASIQDIDTSPGLFANGPWKAPAARVLGQPLSLDDIEHGVIRPVWQDARIHYALNCAALGCANLRAEAYRGARLEAQLDDQARTYVNSPRGVAFLADGGVSVSKIYAWFRADFGGDGGAVLAHLRRNAAPALAARLAAARTIAASHYDWALNDAAAG
jgi:hypothetical protein